jgi:predicted RNase H-like HicB family nuclease
MTYDILIQPLPQGTFQATVLGWPDVSAVGDSEITVIERIKNALRVRLTKSKILRIDLDNDLTMETPHNHLWSPFLGMWRDDPTFDDFIGKMKTHRSEVDEAI